MSEQMEKARAQIFASEEHSRAQLASPDFVDAIRGTDRPQAAIPHRLSSLASIARTRVAGYEVIRIRPKEAAPGIHLVYYHGGAHVFELGMSVWKILAALIRDTGATVTVPVYGLAPEHTIDDAIPFLDAVYREVVDTPELRRLTLVGDSSGANLALAQAIRAREEGWRLPDCLALSSPWVDVTMANPEAVARESLDPMLRCAGLAAAGRVWAGNRSVTDPQVSPIFDALSDLPPMLVFQGDHDIFLPDVTRFADKARAAGTAVSLTVAPGGFHNYLAATFIPESKQALAEIAAAVIG